MPPEQTTTYRALSSSSRLTLLHLLQGRGRMTAAELADAAGLHPNTVREHLERLGEAGFVRREPEVRTTRGRPRILFEAIAGDDPPADAGASRRIGEALGRAELTRVLLAGYGRADGDPARAAHDAGYELADVLRRAPGSVPVPRPTAEDQLDVLADHLTQMGFEPEAGTDPLRFDLRRCPFHDLAVQREEVVCAVHLGLVRGILAGVGGPVRAEALRPFVGPQHCVLDLVQDSTDVATPTNPPEPDHETG